MMLTEHASGSSPDGGEATARGRAGPSTQFARRAANEHVVSRRVQHPVVALAWIVVVARDFDEALVEAEVVSDGVLPALFVLAIVREVANDELVDAVERQSFVRAAADRHHDHGVVAVRRLLGRRRGGGLRYCSGRRRSTIKLTRKLHAIASRRPDTRCKPSHHSTSHYEFLR